jgi:RNA polymerase sigma-70 factor (ECF subfamily)
LAWLSTLARTRAIDAWRARRRQAQRHEALDTQAELLVCEEPGPDALGLLAERAARVRTAVDALPPEQRRALQAAFFSGLTHTEVAAALGQPLGTVKTRIRAGLAALRAALADVEGRAA